MQTTRTFEKLVDAWSQDPFYIDCRGGMRSGKTYSILQMLCLICQTEITATLTSVVSESFPHLAKGAIRDFQTIMKSEGWWEERKWNESKHIYTFPQGSQIEFFSVDADAAHGPARDRIFINEGQNLKWEVVQQLFARTRGLKIFDYNPTHSFWNETEIAGRQRVAKINSTYLDNTFLTEAQVYEIECGRKNENWWRVYGKGETGVLEGLIYNIQIVDSMPDAEGYIETHGLDFGFTNDPTVDIRCLIHSGRKEIYLNEELWRKGMQNPDIAAFLMSRGLKKKSGPVVYADCAEPKSISELNTYDLNVKACDKTGKKKDQIGTMQQYSIFVTAQSTNLIKEFRNYVWDKTKDGELTNEPVAFMDHGMDAFRYGCYTPLSGVKKRISKIG